MKRIALSVLISLLYQYSLGQNVAQDSAKVLQSVTVSAFEQQVPIHRSPISVGVLIPSNADYANKSSLVSGFNTLAGVRMEERSPASYRINIRGSSLRSPFGVRNVKVYWNDIPVTDPGGNTYFNQFGFNNFSTIEIYKGPVSSMYGAGTGGLILMNSFPSTLENTPSFRPNTWAEIFISRTFLHRDHLVRTKIALLLRMHIIAVMVIAITVQCVEIMRVLFQLIRFLNNNNLQQPYYLPISIIKHRAA